ncbi:MAG: Fur family transcriptional regulator, partial [Cytophagales bacterium]
MTTTSSIKELLKKRNLKVTELRMALLEIISSLGKAISYQEIQNSLINFDRITLYRTLNTFIERGILHKIILEDHQSFYALCSIE